MTLTEEILYNWNTDIPGFVQTIESLKNVSYPAWTVKNPAEYGVILLYNGTEDINESFSNARIFSRDWVIDGNLPQRTITLISSDKSLSEIFASLCAALVDPGTNGENRKKVLDSPLEWWKNWKEMLGNKNIDPRIYDVLGELCVLKELLSTGKDISWNGPDSGSYDIETDAEFVEVKSTVTRDKREVTISNQFQLKPEGKPLRLALCQFEPAVMTGVSIDDIVSEINAIGYNVDLINRKLQSMGFDNGMSSRKKKFILHDILCYEVDDDFPRIIPQSFVGGVMPEGIIKITYTVDLSGLSAWSMMRGDARNDL